MLSGVRRKGSGLAQIAGSRLRAVCSDLKELAVQDRSDSFPVLDRAAVNSQASHIGKQVSAGSSWGGCSDAKFRMFSASSATCASSEETAEINPLLQTPTVHGGDGEGSAVAVPSYHGPDRASAKLRDAHISPKKLNHFATMLRRMHVDDALTQCKLSPKKAAKLCYKVIQSARANAATNHGLEKSNLVIDIINVGRGTHLKRMWIHGRGRNSIRLRYRSHMEIILKQTDAKPKQHYAPSLLERPRKNFPQASNQV